MFKKNFSYFFHALLSRALYIISKLEKRAYPWKRNGKKDIKQRERERKSGRTEEKIEKKRARSKISHFLSVQPPA